jgi:hypothetical protein
MASLTSTPAFAALVLAVSLPPAHVPLTDLVTHRVERFTAAASAEPAQTTPPNWDRIDVEPPARASRLRGTATP